MNTYQIESFACFSGVIVNRETVEHKNDKGVPFVDILRQKVFKH